MRLRKLVVLRRISQIFFLLLFIYILWSTTYPLKGLLSPELIFKIDPLILFCVSLSERVILPGFVYGLLMLVLTVLLGRFFCGWVCPLGTFNDGVASFRKKKAVPSDRANRQIRKGKYFLLGIIAVGAVFGLQLAWIFDPLVIMARFVSLNLIPTLTLGVDRLFITLIQNFNGYGAVYDFYRTLKSSVLGIHVYYFSSSGIIFVYFLLISLPVLVISRIWCRMLCPLGAVYALMAGTALLERRVGKCSECGLCGAGCRMGAIRTDGSYDKGECILCMDCVYTCPVNATTFGWKTSEKKKAPSADTLDGGITRKDFLLLLFSSFFLAGFRNRARHGTGSGAVGGSSVIRPPGSLDGDSFLDRCIRCGNCMKVCPTNGLQPIMAESGWEGIWTPQLVPEIGYCEYNCTLCGEVCPTGAIAKLPLPVKQKTRLGTAVINRQTCLPWSEGRSCIVCEEHCPVPDKAIKVREDRAGGAAVLKPVVDRDLCIGCGICQNVCPVRPVRAIRVRG